MTRHVLSGVTFKCVEPGLWADPTGRLVIRRWDDRVPGHDPYWTLEDGGRVVEKSSSFWAFDQSSKLRGDRGPSRTRSFVCPACGEKERTPTLLPRGSEPACARGCGPMKAAGT